ncbi:MAG: acyl-ACP--UDP-N-acetylglucosamine O-acyltransferase [Ignavibacteria bacterium]|nr:acyl-ACP--UDP-N-acetylglucosamine O-acyltransferase [Ignavibacteria bacterium]
MNSVSKKARIGTNVIIGEYTVIKDDVIIGNDVKIGSNVLIDNGARISNNVIIHHGAVISTPPQDLKFEGEITTFEIGENTVIREYATLNRGTKHSYMTVVGKNCFLMAYSHIAHDCKIGDNVIIANAVNMGGHVIIDDWAIIGGIVAIHQFCRIGKHAIIGGGFRAVKDVPPFILAGNVPLKYEGLNFVGLKRRGYTNEQIENIRNVYNIIYKSKYNVSDAIKKIKNEIEQTPEIKTITDFIEASSRGIIRG